MANLFERLRPIVAKKAPEPSSTQLAQLLLEWVLRRTKPTFCTRDARIMGPGAIRGPGKAVAAADILVREGWLAPVKGRYHNERRWEIIRKPIARPIIAAR
jgi:hypothetical protein